MSDFLKGKGLNILLFYFVYTIMDNDGNFYTVTSKKHLIDTWNKPDLPGRCNNLHGTGLGVFIIGKTKLVSCSEAFSLCILNS